MNRLAWLLTPGRTQVLFALRLCVVIALALYLAMWLQLDRPYWAASEAAVMFRLVPGQAVVRGLARVAGTLVAAGMGLVIMALFGQSYEMSVAALAVWVALCAFGASLLRNDLAYGFAISGFLAGLIVVLSHALQMPPFQVAVARGSEAILAAIVTGAIAVLFSPPEGMRSYLQGRLSLLRSVGREFKHLAPGSDHGKNGADGQGEITDDPHTAFQALAAQTLALEQKRQYVRYEAPQFAHYNRLARRWDYDVLSLISAMASLRLYLAQHTDITDTRAIAALTVPVDRLIDEPENPDAVKSAFDKAYEQILQIAREPTQPARRRRLADWVVISRSLGLVSRCRALVITHELLINERKHPPDTHYSSRSEFSPPKNFRNAVRNGLRALVAVGVGGVVWVNFHNQLPAVILMILISALTSILPTVTPRPAAAARLFGRGLAVAAIAAFVVNFLVLPAANGFAMLMLAMLPYVFCAGLAMASPNLALAVPGRISVLMFALLVHANNQSLTTFPTYIQMVMGIAGAIAVTILVFQLVFPITPRRQLREQMVGVFAELANTAVGRHGRERFETRMYDRLNALSLIDLEQSVQSSARRAVLASINIGLEARSLVVICRRMSLPSELQTKARTQIRALRTVLATRKQVPLVQARSHSQSLQELAEQLLAYALSRDNDAERRLGIRSAICAALTASALQEYAQALGHGNEDSAPDTLAAVGSRLL